MIAIGVLSLILIGLVFGFRWIVVEAFGPKVRVVEISIAGNRKIIGKETYSADFAQVFYDVDLIFINQGDSTRFGHTTYYREDWEDAIGLAAIEDWTLLIVRDKSNFYVLGVNEKLGMSIDTTFNSHEIRSGLVGTNEKLDVPINIYIGNSGFDSIQSNRFYLNLYFHLGLNEPSKDCD